MPPFAPRKHFPGTEFEALVASGRQSDMLMNVENQTRATQLKRGFPLVCGLALSLIVHGTVPFWGDAIIEKEPARVSLSLLAMPPAPLPVVEDVPPEPEVVIPSPEKPPPAPTPTRKPKPEPEPEPVPEPAKPAAASIEPPKAPPSPAPESAPAPEPTAPEIVAAKPAPPAEASPAIAAPAETRKPAPGAGRHLDLKRMREESRRRAGLRNRLAAKRQAEDAMRTDAAAGGGAGAKGASTPSLGGVNRGNPEDVYDCGPTELVRRHRVQEQRPLTDWVTVVPTALMPFRTRPSLGDYLGDVAQVALRRSRGEKRAGPVEFALPAEVLQLELEEPAGARLALGLLAGRCVVGLRYARELFPLTLTHVPARIVAPGLPTSATVVTVTLRKDGSFQMVREQGDPLPITSGYLKNHREIAANIENHYAAARMLKEMAGWVGVDLAKMARDERRRKQDELRKKRDEKRKAQRQKRDLARRGKR